MARATRLIIPLMAVAVLLGCSQPERYGEPLSGGRTASIADVLGDPAAFGDTTVTVKGTIVTECPSGCWFEMKEGTAVLYVDIGGHALAIPPRVGSEVVVEGRVTVEGRNVRLAGEGLQIR